LAKDKSGVQTGSQGKNSRGVRFVQASGKSEKNKKKKRKSRTKARGKNAEHGKMASTTDVAGHTDHK